MCWERRERSAVDGKAGADGDHGGPIAVDSCKHGGSVLHPKGSVARDPQVTSKWWHPKGSVVVARPDGGPMSFCSFPCGDAWWTSGDTVVHDPAPHDECFRAAKRARRLPDAEDPSDMDYVDDVDSTADTAASDSRPVLREGTTIRSESVWYEMVWYTQLFGEVEHYPGHHVYVRDFQIGVLVPQSASVELIAFMFD